jgi:tRNA threonylcarbamoyladenosine biosynthesis protein TsaE
MLDRSFSICLPSAEASKNFGRLLGQILSAGSVILLEGDLGAGKTTIVQGIGEGLGIVEPIVSPTFTLIQEYPEGRLPLYHLDLYRLQASDIEALSPEIYWEGIEVQPGITAIEWAQHLPYLPDIYTHIQLTHTGESTRKVKIEFIGAENWGLDATQLKIKISELCQLL